jgi:hypothetical protein
MSNFTDFFPTPSATIDSGTTAQRPGSPTVGVTRFNTTLRKYELYNGANWVSLQSLLYTLSADADILFADTTNVFSDETKF